MTTAANDTDRGPVQRITDRVDDVRDRAAGALSSEAPAAARELTRVRERLDDVEVRLTDQLAGLGSGQAELAHELRADAKRTTTPRRLFWFLLGGAAAAVATWLADPDRGRARRTRVADQLTSQARDLGDQARTQASRAVHRAKGNLIEAGRAATGEDVPDDPTILRQRIKSQVLGRHEGAEDVVVIVDAPGEVSLKGTVASEELRRELHRAVSEVNGVTGVSDRLAVAAVT